MAAGKKKPRNGGSTERRTTKDTKISKKKEGRLRREVELCLPSSYGLCSRFHESFVSFVPFVIESSSLF